MISFVAGFDHRQGIALKDSQGAVVSLAGAGSIRLRAYRSKRENTAAVLDLTTSSSPSAITVSSAALGLLSVLFDGADTDGTFLVGSYVYEITAVLASGDTAIWRGALHVTRSEVTAT